MAAAAEGDQKPEEASSKEARDADSGVTQAREAVAAFSDHRRDAPMTAGVLGQMMGSFGARTNLIRKQARYSKQIICGRIKV